MCRSDLLIIKWKKKTTPNLSLLNICLFLLSNTFAQSKSPLCEVWLAAGRQQAMSPPHGLVLLPAGWQTDKKQPRAGVPCLKSGFQPWPCSPHPPGGLAGHPYLTLAFSFRSREAKAQGLTPFAAVLPFLPLPPSPLGVAGPGCSCRIRCLCRASELPAVRETVVLVPTLRTN